MIRDGRSERDGADVFLRMRGLPFQASERDVTAFFEGFGLRRCVLLTNNDGRCTGALSTGVRLGMPCCSIFPLSPSLHHAPLFPQLPL